MKPGIGPDATRDGLGVDLIHRVDIGDTGHGVGVAADVNEWDYAGFGAGNHVSGQRADVRNTHRATIKHGGDASAHANLIWVTAIHPDPMCSDSVGDMGVDVDQARRDISAVALDLDDPFCRGRGNI